METDPHKRRPAFRRAAFRVFVTGLCFAIWYLLVYPKSPLTDAWNPFEPLHVADNVTPLTSWKLRVALSHSESCFAALQTGGVATQLADFAHNEQCHIRPQVKLSGVGAATMVPLRTRCQTALRLAMWERHGIQPAAARHLQTEVHRIRHFSSYNCRAMRTTRGGAARMSTHATADAVDISGFDLANGRRLTLRQHWNGTPHEQAFFREIRDSACKWFRVTLGPDYNILHADHFHLQHSGWGLCR